MSSKAKTLGAGRFGSSAAAPVSARRQAVAAATGVPTEGVAPPTQLPVDRISPNPDNPRSSLGDLGELAGSLKEHGQKQAITVMHRDAYLKANPGKAAELEPDTTYVVIDGSSRLAAAREAGLSHIKVWVDDDQGTDSEQLLESALVANIHRNALPELDEARALQRLLGIHGSQAALAKRLHKSQGWVSQRLALLNLTPELQEKIGEEPIKFLRAVGNKPQEEQAAALEEMKRRAAQEKAAASEASSKAADEALGSSAHPADGVPGRHYPVMGSEETAGVEAPGAPAEQGGGGPAGHYPVMTPPAEQPGAGTASPGTEPVREQPGSLPEPRTGPSEMVSGSRADDQDRRQSQGPDHQQPRLLPYDDPFYVAGHLRRKMQPQHRARLVRFLLDGLKEESEEDYREVLREAVDVDSVS